MLRDFVQTIIHRQQSTKKVRQRSAKRLSEIVWTPMADILNLMEMPRPLKTIRRNFAQFRVQFKCN
jgi:hypothetical protein